MAEKDKKNTEEEVYKCSKCGLCKSVCPIFIATKNENYLPRGRFIILNKFYKDKDKNNITKEFIKNTDICLNCNQCKRFCPSNIDTTHILTEIKYNNKYKYSLFHFSTIYFLKLRLYKIFHFGNFLKTTKIQNKTAIGNKKVVYFEGCFNKYINPNDKNAVISILNKLNYNITNINTNCCGLPYLSDGNLDMFFKNAKKIIKSIPEDTEHIVCSCDSCYETLKQAFKSDEKILHKLIRQDEIIKQNQLNFNADNNTVFHIPVNRTDEFSSIPANIKPINKKGICTLMENFFLLKHKAIAKSLLKPAFYKKEEIDNKKIITTCNISKWGLIKGIKMIKAKTKVYSYSEYINNSIKDTKEKD